MAYPEYTKSLAIALRRQGYSIKEIAAKLEISNSTASVWLQYVLLDKQAQKRLRDRQILGQYKSALIRRNKTKDLEKSDILFASKLIKSINFKPNINLLCCALLYWAEGAKTISSVGFTNSDPTMISTFLSLFRKSFEGLDESKFRCLVHIHEYHNDAKIKEYWSLITGIPISQFQRSYLKPHTGHRKKDDYHGTISVRYYDSRIVHRLKALYNIFSQNIGV